MTLDFDTCYRAVLARDPRFDGRFFTGVTSTGIYCRPVCPARTPARANIRFFPHPGTAGAAGFRACRRRRPEASPGSPEWSTRADLQLPVTDAAFASGFASVRQFNATVRRSAGRTPSQLRAAARGPGADPEQAAAELAGVPGTGPWTVSYVLLRTGADPDAFPGTDLALRRAMGRLGASPGHDAR